MPKKQFLPVFVGILFLLIIEGCWVMDFILPYVLASKVIHSQQREKIKMESDWVVSLIL